MKHKIIKPSRVKVAPSSLPFELCMRMYLTHREPRYLFIMPCCKVCCVPYEPYQIWQLNYYLEGNVEIWGYAFYFYPMVYRSSLFTVIKVITFAFICKNKRVETNVSCFIFIRGVSNLISREKLNLCIIYWTNEVHDVFSNSRLDQWCLRQPALVLISYAFDRKCNITI